MGTSLETEQTISLKIAKRAVCLQVRFGAPGSKRGVSANDVVSDDTTADRALIHVSKDIFDSKLLKEIRRRDHDLRTWLRRKSGPSPFLGGGIHLVPVTMVPDFTERLDSHATARWGRIQEFLYDYQRDGGLVDQARKRLGNLWSKDDYPSSQRLLAAFSFRYLYTSFETPVGLSAISQEIYKREQQKASDRLVQVEQDYVLLLRGQLKDLLDSMVGMLLPGDGNGKRKQFRTANVAKLREFLRELPARNIIDDDEITSIASQAADLLDGLDVGALKKDPDMRMPIGQAFETVRAELEKLVIDRPKRRIMFDD